MKKSMCIFLMFAFSGTVYGFTLCKKTNTAVAVLNKTVNGTVSSADNMAWKIQMDNGITVSGKAICTSIAGTSGAVNTSVTDSSATGKNCFCRMQQPASSYWVFNKTYDTNNACATGCTTTCANSIAVNQTFRSSIYESIW